MCTWSIDWSVGYDKCGYHTAYIWTVIWQLSKSVLVDSPCECCILLRCTPRTYRSQLAAQVRCQGFSSIHIIPFCSHAKNMPGRHGTISIDWMPCIRDFTSRRGLRFLSPRLVAFKGRSYSQCHEAYDFSSGRSRKKGCYAFTVDFKFLQPGKHHACLHRISQGAFNAHLDFFCTLETLQGSIWRAYITHCLSSFRMVLKMCTPHSCGIAKRFGMLVDWSEPVALVVLGSYWFILRWRFFRVSLSMSTIASPRPNITRYSSCALKDSIVRCWYSFGLINYVHSIWGALLVRSRFASRCSSMKYGPVYSRAGCSTAVRVWVWHLRNEIQSYSKETSSFTWTSRSVRVYRLVTRHGTSGVYCLPILSDSWEFAANSEVEIISWTYCFIVVGRRVCEPRSACQPDVTYVSVSRSFHIFDRTSCRLSWQQPHVASF